MRDKLIDLILYSDILCDNCGENSPSYCAEALAEHLLENGVIVPPCMVGDTVYALWSVPTETKYIVYCAEVKKISQYKKNCQLTTFFELEPIEFRGRRKEYQIDDFGKTVFLTRESAEQALKGGADNA